MFFTGGSNATVHAFFRGSVTMVKVYLACQPWFVNESEVVTPLVFDHSGSGAVPADAANSKEDDESDSDDRSSHHRVALNEVHALSHRVSRIDDSTAVVPRGAFRLKFGNKIAPAPEFKGLSFGEAQKISSWVHFRPAENLENLKALASTDYQVRHSTPLRSK
uniref:Radial spoke head protein 9 homolog n=1 Tax=Toxoplasma gondii (strain ATCC 50861 / VEG) TaxID=432359 RepID=A0A0F7V083_TOXGV|nr:TPA: Radial spoke head protein 9, putative [Toxoplasma gondii VEG]